MVAFASASAAVKCAVAMQQLFDRRYRDAEQGLHVRIGVAAGEATVKDGDYFDTPSIEAARLCDQAPADGILVSGLAKALAGRCEGITLHSAGELELKGFSGPVEAFCVSWAPLGQEDVRAGRWPLPAVLRSVPPVAYVGRVEERAALQEAMALARSGQRQVVLLSGEPGIGKTRLSSYAAHQAHAEGFAVVWGSCSEELAVPYEPWIGVCSQLVEHAPEELLARHVESHRGELARLARNFGGRIAELPEPQSSDPETERYLLFNAVAGVLGDAAETVPLCVVLDDLHWADAQSLALLKHLLRDVQQGCLQVIATYRDSELGKDHPLGALLADLHSLQGVQRIALRGLGTDEVAEVMAAVAGHELNDEGRLLAGEIEQETDGNPFFVGEMLRGLLEAGALVFDDEARRWSVDRSAVVALPRSVREVIERRVERLDEARSIVEQAARHRSMGLSPNQLMLSALAGYASATVRTRHLAAAEALYERISPFSDQVVWATAHGFGHAQLWLGLLAACAGKHERADRHLAFACEFHEANHMPLFTAHGHIGWAEALLERGDVSGAREHAKRALELSRKHGYGEVAPRAAAIIATGSAAQA